MCIRDRLFIVLFLLGFGMIMVYSTSSYEASLSASLKYDEAYYLKHQALAAVMGLVAMIVVANIPYHFWERFAVLGYFVSAILIALVLTPLGIEANGARRWLNLGLSVQPAEIAKLCMILFLASFICKMGKGLSLIHISEPTRLGMISYDVFCLKNKQLFYGKTYGSEQEDVPRRRLL